MKPDELRQAIEDGTLTNEDIQSVIDDITKDIQEDSAKQTVKILHRVFLAGKMVGACETLKELNEAATEAIDDPDANVSYGGTA